MPLIQPRRQQTRSGTIAMSSLKVNYPVVFDTPMPSTNYKVYYAASGLSVNVSITAKTATGFTLVLALGLSGTIDWIVQDVF